MDDENQPIITLPFQSDQVPQNLAFKKSKFNKSKVLMMVLCLILLGAVGYGSYSYGTKKNSNSSTESSSAATSTFHTVAYSILGTEPRISIKLAFPDNYQAIASSNGQDTFRSLFGDNNGSSIYEGGNWDIGNPNNVNGNFAGYIGIMGIAPDWYGRDGFATYGGFNGDSYTTGPSNITINGYNFSTATQKKESLNKLISDTSNCAKDSTKGFSTSGVFNVCFNPTLIRQAYAAYSPTINFSGYASIKGVPYVLFGWVFINSGLDNYSADALNKAGDDFKAGKIPGPTQKNIDAFIAALKNSTVVY